MKNGAHYLMLNQCDKEMPFTHIPKWKSIASRYVFIFLSQATRVYRILLLIKTKTYSSKESLFWCLSIILSTYDLAVTVSLDIQKILWSIFLVLHGLCHLLGHLQVHLSQSVGCRNMQNSKYILDL